MTRSSARFSPGVQLELENVGVFARDRPDWPGMDSCADPDNDDDQPAVAGPPPDRHALVPARRALRHGRRGTSSAPR